MVTIQDVAKAAGVSVATVSRVLNNSPRVTPETRMIVEAAIKELNYQPNLLGRNLRRAESKTILVLLPSISNPFYSRVVRGMEDTAQKYGYNIMLCNDYSEAEMEKNYLELLKKRIADGVIFTAPVLSAGELEDIAKDYPVVQCCEYIPGASLSHVSIDNEAAAYKAVKHLIDLGHRRIGFVGTQSVFISAIQRENGYKKALLDHGIEVSPELIQYGNYGFLSGLNVARSLVKMKNRPTAIFAISDVMAMGVMRAITDCGLSVPKDVSVVGFDNIDFSSMISPALTTVSQPRYRLGQTAMEILLEQLKNGTREVKEVILDSKLVIRDSTGALKSAYTPV